MNFLSKKCINYPQSGIRMMFELASKFPNAINLTLGEPNFETPENIKNVAIESIKKGMTKYSSNNGIIELRNAIAKRYYDDYKANYEADNVMITFGGMEAIFLALSSVIDPGDEVIVPNPGYPNYLGSISLLGAKSIEVPLYEENNFVLQATDLEKVINPRTKALILNYPSNPIGAVISRIDFEKLLPIIIKNNLIVISDEVYDKIFFNEAEYFSISQFDEIKKQVIIINSFSKTYAMTGWRIGYAIGDKNIIDTMPKMQEGLASCIPPFIQKAAIEALTGPQDSVVNMVQHYRRRRNLIVNGLNNIPGFSCLSSGGAFYAFPSIKAFGIPSLLFTENLLKKADVACVPGSAFGSMGEGFIRISFANSDENLIEAIKRIENYVYKELI